MLNKLGGRAWGYGDTGDTGRTVRPPALASPLSQIALPALTPVRHRHVKDGDWLKRAYVCARVRALGCCGQMLLESDSDSYLQTQIAWGYVGI